MPVDPVKQLFLEILVWTFLTFGNDTLGDQVRYATHLILVSFLTCEFFIQFMLDFQSWRLFF